MSKIRNPSAFPVLERCGNSLDCVDPGMDLREWFAANAMSALIASPNLKTKEGKGVAIEWEDIAKAAYDMADAMLAVRAGHKPIDIDAMLAACIPGGSSCDPQAVADSIREYWAKKGAAA